MFTRVKKQSRRLLSMLCAAVVATAGMVCGAPTAEAGQINYALSDVTLYKWTRVKSEADLHKSGDRDYLILWEEKNSSGTVVGEYYADATTVDSNGMWDGRSLSDSGDLTTEDSFITIDRKNPVNLRYYGDDKDNQNDPIYYVTIAQNSTDRYLANLAPNARFWDFSFSARLSLRVGHKSSDDGLSEGEAILYQNLKSQTDVCLSYSNNELLWNSNFSSWSKGSPFYLYYRTPLSYACINSDMVIGKGQSYKVDNNVLLAEGCTITVEEGGLLSIEGTFYNSGSVINKGTVVLQQGACMTPLTSGDGNGALTCDGGDVVLLSNSRMYFADGCGVLTMQNGSNIVNCGDIVSAGPVRLSGNSHITNRDTGIIYFNSQFTGSLANVPSHTRSGAQINNISQSRTYFNINNYQNVAATGVTLLDSSGIENHGTIYQSCGLYTPGTGGVTGDGTYEAKQPSITTGMEDWYWRTDLIGNITMVDFNGRRDTQYVGNKAQAANYVWDSKTGTTTGYLAYCYNDILFVAEPSYVMFFTRYDDITMYACRDENVIRRFETYVISQGSTVDRVLANIPQGT